MTDVRDDNGSGGHLWRIIQAHIDTAGPYPPTEAAVARRMGVSRQTMSNWKAGAMPKPENVRAIAALTGQPYLMVLRAALIDAGYLQEHERASLQLADPAARRNS